MPTSIQVNLGLQGTVYRQDSTGLDKDTSCVGGTIFSCNRVSKTDAAAGLAIEWLWVLVHSFSTDLRLYRGEYTTDRKTSL
jgi:hypothetical protein